MYYFFICYNMDVFFEANKHNTTEKKDFPTLNTDLKKNHFANTPIHSFSIIV